MTTALAVADRQHVAVPVEARMSLRDKLEYCKYLSQGDFLPKEYHGKPANVMAAVEYGEAVGLANGYMAILGTAIISGRPSPYAATLAALVRHHGHRLRVQWDGTTATATLIRRDDPDFTFSAAWTLARAKTAGLTNNAMYAKYPDVMLKRRAIAEVCRDACSEVLAGLHIPEELGHYQDPTGGAALVEDTGPKLEPEAKPKQAGRAYTSITTGTDLPKRGRPPAQPTEPAVATEPLFDASADQAVQGELVQEPEARDEIWAYFVQTYGDKAKARCKEFCGGQSLKEASAEQCAIWLARLETLNLAEGPDQGESF